MIYIAHRGNINGPNQELENEPNYLLEAIHLGFHVETDLWYIDDILYLGHDQPTYTVTADFLNDNKTMIFCHCKNLQAMFFLLKHYPDVECFYHSNDKYVLTSNRHIWNYIDSELTELSICVLPEKNGQYLIKCYGVCTDYPILYKNNSL